MLKDYLDKEIVFMKSFSLLQSRLLGVLEG